MFAWLGCDINEAIIEAIMRASPESCFMRSAHNTAMARNQSRSLTRE
jgi:hypothetical protein